MENLLPKEMPGLRELPHWLPAYSCPPTYISPGLLRRRLDETAKAAKEEMKKKKRTMIMLMTID